MLKLKDIIIIGVVMVCLSPVIYFFMLLATNNARIEFGQPKKDENSLSSETIRTVKSSAAKDTLIAKYSKSYQASEQQRTEIAEQQARLIDEKNRLEMVRSEIEREKNALAEERRKMESLVGESDSLELKKIKQLSKVYSAMRPAEAARILETLDNSLAAKIIGGITDAAIKAKIMQTLSEEKVKSITGKMLK